MEGSLLKFPLVFVLVVITITLFQPSSMPDFDPNSATSCSMTRAFLTLLLSEGPRHQQVFRTQAYRLVYPLENVSPQSLSHPEHVTNFAA